jgi:membrane-bound ClpP family serine protease
MLVRGHRIETTEERVIHITSDAVQIDPLIVAPFVASPMLLFLLVLLLIVSLRAKTWKKLALNTNIDSRAVVAEAELVVVGQRGKAMTRLTPSGTVRFENAKVEARAFEGMIEPGHEVEVVLIEDNKIYVKQL